MKPHTVVRGTVIANSAQVDSLSWVVAASTALECGRWCDPPPRVRDCPTPHLVGSGLHSQSANTYSPLLRQTCSRLGSLEVRRTPVQTGGVRVQGDTVPSPSAAVESAA